MDTLYVNRNSFDVDFGPILQYRHYCPRWRRLSNAAFNERAILTKCNRTEVKLRRMRTARKRASDETRRRLGGELDRSTTADHVEQTTQHTQRSNDFKRVTHAVQATNIYDVTMTSCATGNFFYTNWHMAFSSLQGRLQGWQGWIVSLSLRERKHDITKNISGYTASHWEGLNMVWRPIQFPV